MVVAQELNVALFHQRKLTYMDLLGEIKLEILVRAGFETSNNLLIEYKTQQVCGERHNDSGIGETANSVVLLISFT